MARISVLIGVYNCADTLCEALDSLYNQTYTDFKIIMCEDGSTDDTYIVAKKYAESKDNIILIRNERNMGLNYTLNRCLELADTEFIARMDGDDISMPERFATEVKFLDEHPEYGVVSTPCTYFDADGIFREAHGRGEVVAKHFLRRPPISHAPCMARIEVFKAVGGYTVDDRLLRVEDYNLWFKIYAAGYKLYQMPKSLYLMRDDRNAIRRRTWKNRCNEVYCKYTGYRMIGIPWYYWVYALESILIHFLPSFVYKYLHRRKK